jgi:hypothetical protein
MGAGRTVPVINTSEVPLFLELFDLINQRGKEDVYGSAFFNLLAKRLRRAIDHTNGDVGVFRLKQRQHFAQGVFDTVGGGNGQGLRLCKCILWCEKGQNEKAEQ